MDKIIYLTLLLSVITLQNTDAQQGWDIGIDYFPNISVESSDNLGADGSKFSNSIGITVTRGVTHRLAISGGINFANTGHTREFNAFRWGTQHDGQGGFDPGLDPQEDIGKVKIIHNYYHLEVPVKLLYTVIDGKFRCYLSGAAVPRIHLGDNLKTKTYSDHSQPVENESEGQVDYQTFTLGFQSGIGIEKQIMGRSRLFLEPRMQFNPIRGEFLGKPVEGRYISYGAALGMKLGLSK